MFYTLSPSKPINFEPRFILKLPQNSKLNSVKPSQNANNIQRKTRRERERDYLQRCHRSTGKRERPERWSDVRERRRERGLVGLKEP